MLRLIVFDFDGVLVDSNAVKQSAYGDVLRDLPGAAEALTAAQQKHPGADRFGVLKATLHILRGETVSVDADVQRYAAHYNEICERYTSTCAEIPGVTETLPLLQRNYGLAINSDTPKDPLTQVVLQRGWSGWFKQILGRPQTKEENFSHLFNTLQVMPGETLFIGDRERDREAAQRTGCFFVGMKNTFNNFLQTPEWMVQDLYGIPALLKSGAFRRALHV